jgi:hypothetical protein
VGPFRFDPSESPSNRSWRRSLRERGKGTMNVHMCKGKTFLEAYQLANLNDVAPGIDGGTFEAIETKGVEVFLDQLRKESEQRTCRPLRVPTVGFPKRRRNPPIVDSDDP